MKMKKGAVAFLDVLGWKKADNRAEHLIKSFIKMKMKSKNDCKVINNAIQEEKLKVDGILGDIVPLYFSDTIILCAEGQGEYPISILTTFCNDIMPKALEQGLPLRGAISCGEYYVNKKHNVVSGNAVDEVASWYENTDWIGVILTPSAKMTIEIVDADFTKSRITKYDDIPFKAGKGESGNTAKWNKMLNLCVDWQCENKDVLCPKGVALTPKIANKYLNTLAFLERNKAVKVVRS